MNILSLFDGCSGGQLAFQRAGIKVNKYFASEIDKYAIQITQKNFPNTIQLGDINSWEKWGLPKIDFIIGGSPCQGFSFAGKQLNFEDPRSKLFFKFVDILNHIRRQNPDVKFLLENVKMKKEYQDVISRALGVEPININSNLVSAQNRNRFYWTNINGVKQPGDKGLYLKDIVDMRKEHEKIEHSPRRIFKKNYVQYDINNKKNGSQDQRAYYLNGKHGCLDTAAKSKSKYIDTKGNIYKLNIEEIGRLQTLPIEYINGVSEAQQAKMIGNGFTIDVIAHILKGLNKDTTGV